jgi:hypothetical protein
MLSADFEIKSREKLQLLLQQRATPQAPAPVAAIEVQEPTPSAAVQPQEPVVVTQEPPPAVPLVVETIVETEVEVSNVVVNEKLVKLSDLSGRKTVIKDAPSSLDAVASEEDLSKFSLEALKKLAKSAALDHSKQINKPALLALLVDAHRKARADVRGAPEEAEAETACLR